MRWTKQVVGSLVISSPVHMGRSAGVASVSFYIDVKKWVDVVRT